RSGRIPDDGNARESGNGLLQQLQTFDISLGHHQRTPGGVAARPRETCHVAGAERVRVTHEYDWNRRGRLFGRPGVNGTRRYDDIDLEPDEFLRKLPHPLRLCLPRT